MWNQQQQGPPASGGWGAPPATSNWGVPPATPGPPAGGWGAPPAQAGGWGAPPPVQSGGWGAPPPAQGGWGAPPPAQGGGWGAPPPQSGGWGAPPPAQGGWGAPPPGGPPQGGWGAPPPQQGGWGAPPPQQGGWGAPPPGGPPQGGWGAPPPQQGGWGAPPPGGPQQGGWNQPPGQTRVGETGAPPGAANKRAVLIGINYLGHQKGRLRGCINDVKNIQQTLTKFGFVGPNVKVMTDDLQDRNMLPTKQNIMRELRWLTANVRPGDSLFFHFSGHGSQVADQNGDEDDGLDETILPMDYNVAGQIIDDDLNDILVQTIPEGAKLTALMDCCHSGTGMDLPFVHVPSTSGRAVKQDKKQKKKKKKDKKKKKGPTDVPGGSKGEVVLFSGCRDDQTGADASINGQATGAMTWAFTTCLNKNPNVTYDGLLCAMRDLLNGGGGRTFTQVPQLSTGRQMDLNQPFRI